MTGFQRSVPFRGKEITVQLTVLDRGVHVLLTGGDSSHAGAVAVAQNGILVHSFSLPNHREKELAERWATSLSEVYAEAAVTCGIHYDAITQEEITDLLALCEKLLHEARKRPASRTPTLKAM